CPSAGPLFPTAEAEDRRGRFNEIAGAVVSDPKLLDYLARHHDGEAYLLATVNSRLAAPVVIATGMPVMSLGGFNGMAPILQPEDFAQRVVAHQVRFALIGDGSQGLRRGFRGGGGTAGGGLRSGHAPAGGSGAGGLPRGEIGG